MKALYFAKIDYIKTKRQMWFLPMGLLLITAIMLFGSSAASRLYNATYVLMYSVFLALSFSTAPFGACRREDAGFMLLLPAATRDRIVGRFLYGVSMMLLAAAAGVIYMIGWMAVGSEFSLTELAVYLIALAVGILIMTVEYVFLYLFGENQGPQMLNIVRVIPAMCYFFGGINLFNKILARIDMSAYLMEEFGETGDIIETGDFIAAVISHLGVISIVGIVAALIVLVAAIALCVKVTEKKDY